MIYAYYSAENVSDSNVTLNLESYAKEHGFSIDQIISDEYSNKVHWEKRKLNTIIKGAAHGDILVVHEASDLARSTLQVLEVMDLLVLQKMSLHIIRYDEVFHSEEVYSTGNFLRLMKFIEGEFVTKRTTDALARRRAAGLPLGRPKGRRNKTRKLDKHRTEIKKYLLLDINKASIAKLVGCHAQTLYNYLEDTNLLEELEDDKKNGLDLSGVAQNAPEILILNAQEEA